MTLAINSTLLTHPARNPKLRRRPDKDLVPIAGQARTPVVLVTADTAQAPHTLAELKTWLAGGGVFGSAGNGALTHPVAECFVRQAGMKAVHAPYRGSGQALSDVAGCRLLPTCDTAAAAPFLVRGGKRRAQAVMRRSGCSPRGTAQPAAQGSAGAAALRTAATRPGLQAGPGSECRAQRACGRAPPPS